MSQQNINTIRRFWEGFNAHNLNIWDEVCTADFVNHDPGLPTPDADLPTLKQSITGLLTAFPDLQAVEEDLLATGDKVAVRLTMRGTHKDTFMGVPATGNPIEFSGIWLAHMEGGKLKEQWVYFTVLGLMMQIGAVPPPG